MCILFYNRRVKHWRMAFYSPIFPTPKFPVYGICDGGNSHVSTLSGMICILAGLNKELNVCPSNVCAKGTICTRLRFQYRSNHLWQAKGDTKSKHRWAFVGNLDFSFVCLSVRDMPEYVLKSVLTASLFLRFVIKLGGVVIIALVWRSQTLLFAQGVIVCRKGS